MTLPPRNERWELLISTQALEVDDLSSPLGDEPTERRAVGRLAVLFSLWSSLRPPIWMVHCAVGGLAIRLNPSRITA
uniref:hypothetical protein n=1 Tax=Actinomadura sp. CA-154981 TaxID=3240037 RepID=UPI003F499197